jgi:hypothetical protein
MLLRTSGFHLECRLSTAREGRVGLESFQLVKKWPGHDDAVMTFARLSSRRVLVSLLLLVLALPALAKDNPLQVIDWPSSDHPSIRFTFGKFKQLSGMTNLRGYVMDTMAQNLSSKPIAAAQFSVYLIDKNKVRVGEDTIALNNVAPGETVKFQTTISASGSPVSLSVQDMAQERKPISMTVNSTPQGALLKVDGTEVGTTPRLVIVGVGRHTLTFSKEGFTAGNFPLEISPQDVSGGSVTYEMGASALDSVELRDGSVVTGDLVSISGMDVEIRNGGDIQHFDRNRIKRIMLVQRDVPATGLPAAAPNQ